MNIKSDGNLTNDMRNLENFFESEYFSNKCASNENDSLKWKEQIDGNFEKVFISKEEVTINDAHIYGPAYIGKKTELRAGSLLRGNVFLEENVRVGHASEVKNSYIGRNTKLAHFNYVGDSYISNNVNISAGVICSNYKQIPAGGDINYFDIDGVKRNSKRRLLGSFIGDNTQIGCNCVIFPGSYVGSGTVIYPLCCVRGTIPNESIIKNNGEVVKIE